eukprot:scaffold6067_cov112-Isochrysis_galbana.AAC.22
MSAGSPSLRMSHQSTCPSVEVDAHSYAVLPCSHQMSYTGSLCDFSMMDVSIGVSPRRVSQYEMSPLYEPPTSRCGSFGLYLRQHSGEDGTSSCSGKHLVHTPVLELHEGKADGQFLAAIGVPADGGDGALGLVGVLEDGECLGRRRFAGVVVVLALKVILRASRRARQEGRGGLGQQRQKLGKRVGGVRRRATHRRGSSSDAACHPMALECAGWGPR